jgi:hypothetical protein
MNRTHRAVFCTPALFLGFLLGAAQLEHTAPSDFSLRGNEFLADTCIQYTQARGNQAWPSVAYDGVNYLVVWQDSRAHPQHDIFCARVNSQGVVLDPAGIHVATATYDNITTYTNGTPTVAYNGSEFLITYQDRRNSSETDIYCSRVTTSGIVLDPDGIAVSTAPGYQRYPSVSSNGSDYLIVWEDSRSGTPNIFGARVTQAGLVLDTEGVEICSAAHTQTFPCVAFDGTNYFTVWQDARDTTNNQYDIYGARVNMNGILLDTNSIAIFVNTAEQIEPSVDFDGTNYLVVWEDHRTQVLGINGARMDVSGTVLDPSGFVISGIPNQPEWQPSVTYNGTDYFVVWTDDRNGTYPDIYGARVDVNGTVLDTSNIPISLTPGVKGLPAVASNGSEFLAVWEDDRDYPSGDLYGARVSAAGTVLDPQGIDVTTCAVFHDDPGVAYCGTNFFVAWGDYRYGLYSSDIYGARVDVAGNILDSPSFMVCTAPFGQYSPSITYDGTNYCAVWTHNIGGAWATKGTRVSPAGVVLDPAYINVSSGGNALNPRISSSGKDFLTAWVDYRNSYTSPDIYGARIGPAGNVLDPTGIAISTLDGLEYMPSVGFGGSRYLVAWDDMRNGLRDIYCARIDSNGTVVDPNGIAVSVAASSQSNSAIAFDGTNYLIVWQDKRNGTHDIYGARVTQNGAVLDPSGLTISTAAGDQINPSVAFDGTNFVVVWEDYRILPSDIYGALVNTTGTVIDSFVVTAQPGPQRYPKIYVGYGPQMIIAYNGWTDSINTHPANAMRTWAVFYPSTGIVEETEYTTNDAALNLSVSPNPFTHTTDIKYMNQAFGNANFEMRKHELEIYDASGRLVKNILLPTTYYLMPIAVLWNGTDNFDRKLPSGVYFVKLVMAGGYATEKVLLVR